ncbi:heme NO-binding domain-containing protein [Natrinema salinisoli]|uniref:heme NO-binding domain-containing protein n=1 Tax=Natrinema salinisoli TaxID=2878535 RepID=UPI001CF031D5|nr:heme NO-binding domain-containing protein [Natrinema salinisoli]
MHGIILKGLKDFTIEQYDEATWNRIRDEADVERRLYVPVTEYPDEHVFELVTTASEISGVDPPILLRAFGRFLVPQLVQTYGVHVEKDWDGLELIENVEEYIHMALRAKDMADFTPPAVDARRLDENRVVVRYNSDRQLCEVAIGILVGIGEFYDESYTVTESQCMHDGAPKCEIVVEREIPTSLDNGDDSMNSVRTP